MTDPAPIFDGGALIAKRNRAASNFASHDFLVRRAAEDIADRLIVIQRDFQIAAEIGSRTGILAEILANHPAGYKIGRLNQFEPAPEMCVRNPVKPEAGGHNPLPLESQSYALIVSLLNLHNVEDLPGALIQCHKALKPDGLFIGALFGGETLIELRQSFLQAESELENGVSPRVHPNADIRDLGGLLQRAGFALPVTDSDRVTVTYDHPLQLMSELRAMGETNALNARRQGFTRRATLRRACEIYQERFGTSDGRIPATFEIITLTGWAPHDSQQKPLKPGSGQISLTKVLGRNQD